MFLYLNGSKEVLFFFPLISGGYLRVMVSVDSLEGFDSFIGLCENYFFILSFS